MSIRSCLFIVLCCLIGYGTLGQTAAPAAKKSCSCGLSSINQVGLVTGEGNAQLQFQSINGFRYRTWFTGIGLGVDNYSQMSVPLFLEVRKYLWESDKGAPFLYSDIGFNMPVNTEVSKAGDYWIYKYRSGLYYDLGLGYALPIGGNKKILISTGFSGKHYKVNQTLSPLVDIYCTGGCITNQTYHYRLNRWSVKVGVQF